MPGRDARAFQFALGKRLPSATTTLAATTPATTATATVGTARSSRTARPGSAGILSRSDGSSIGAVEVRLIFFVELFRLVFVEVFPALDEDRALVGARLAVVEFAARTRWAWSSRGFFCAATRLGAFWLGAG